jgi:5-dehydro-2-deoxygluconokinase
MTIRKARADLDLIAIGRSSVDLYGQQTGGRLEDMASFAKYVGGSPTNTAIGARRLGLSTAALTRVGADHMGRFIREQLAREGVNVEGVVSDPERLTALVILGIRDRETFPLIFYREDCADMALDERDINEDFIVSAKAGLVNGTHLSRPNVFTASHRAATLAKKAGRKVVFDIDYRPVLWGLTLPEAGENRFVSNADVTAQLQRIVALCDAIVGTEEEIHILGGTTDTVAALKTIRRNTDAIIICKRGADGCVAFDKAIPDTLGQGLVVPGYPVEVFNVLGAGDAFMSGFLCGWLPGEPLEICCQYANAAGAIVVSRHGCAPAMPTWPELQKFLSMAARPEKLREDVAFEHLHWATTRHPPREEVYILAVDHRTQIETLAAQTGNGIDRIGKFKSLALDAVERVGKGDSRFGILLDGRHGSDALARAADLPYWIGLPIELPQVWPLEFESSPDVATELLQWPRNHTVKCLCFFHPNDEREGRERQERQLLRLFDACRKTGHEFLLEIISARDHVVDSMTVSKVIQRLYDLGIKPDWWKLEPVADAQSWRNIEAAILANDPYCRGVVLLGLAATEETLRASFESVASVRIVKGFAVGRTIFNEAAQAWFSGKIGDEEAIDMLAYKFTVLTEAWQAAKRAAR